MLVDPFLLFSPFLVVSLSLGLSAVFGASALGASALVSFAGVVLAGAFVGASPARAAVGAMARARMAISLVIARNLAPLFALSAFLSAFLLFQVQPISGKAILPWFGGGPAVWTVCLLFFQAVLLAGYAYAHVVATRLSPVMQRRVHVTVLGLALAIMLATVAGGEAPILPPASWKPDGVTAPVAHILGALVRGVGLPYFALSATAPLVQHWFARAHPGVTPYRLYALSNAGSLIALVTYPFLVEPRWSLHVQTYVWFAGFVVLAAALVACARPIAAAQAQPLERSAKPALAVRAAWVVAPAVTSMLLLATTSEICQSVAPIPFLWIAPLALYLVSFVLCFESDRIYRRWIFVPALAIALVAAGLFISTRSPPIIPGLAIYGAALFTVCMALHGEVARLRPAPDRLTEFFLSISVGGVLGGVAVAVVAPRVLDGYWELELALWLSGALVLALVARDRRAWLAKHRWFARVAGAAALAALTAYAWLLLKDIGALRGDVALLRRGFYGVLSVDELSVGTRDAHGALYHGQIVHGTEFRDPQWKCSPTTYYNEKSGVGRSVLNHPARASRPLRVGAVGLGTGTIASLARPEDSVRFYEIDPEVIALSRGPDARFHYLECGAHVDIAIGDARLSLERDPPQAFDVLAIDAFSGDTIPVHLLTREAVEVYLRHLADGGLLAIHISNHYLDLEPVLAAHAHDLHLASVFVGVEEDDKSWGSDWVVLARDASALERAGLTTDTRPLGAGYQPWTDDASDVFSILK